MPYETGADELAYQKRYAKKRLSEDAMSRSMAPSEKKRRRTLWNRVVARAEGAAPDRKAASDAGSKGGNVDAPNQPSVGKRLSRVFGSLQVTEKLEKNLKKVEKKSRP